MAEPATQIANRRRRGMSATAILLTCGVFLSSERSGYGQTNDHFYRTWRWSTTPATPRAVGLAGAYSALADDSGTAFLNPAGIATLVKSVFSVSVLADQPGTVGLDRLGAWTGLAAGSGAVRLSKKTALACYFVRPRAGPSSSRRPACLTARRMRATSMPLSRTWARWWLAVLRSDSASAYGSRRHT